MGIPKKLLVGIAALLVLVVFLFSGTGVQTGNELFHSGERDGTHRYFKTPHAAAVVAGELVRTQSWGKLAEYYDFSGTDLSPQDLAESVYFLIPQGLGGHTPPFETGYQFREILGTEFPDVFEVVVGHTDESGVDHMQFFYMRRYPEGYRLLLERPSDEDEDPFE